MFSRGQVVDVFVVTDDVDNDDYDGQTAQEPLFEEMGLRLTFLDWSGSHSIPLLIVEMSDDLRSFPEMKKSIIFQF